MQRMKLTIILMLIPIYAFCQEKGREDTLSIFGQVVLENNDEISKNRIALIRNLGSSVEENKTIPFEVSEKGLFKIENLTYGKYKLTFRINESYLPVDTIVNVSPHNKSNFLNILPTKKPCNYDANIDIYDNSTKILIGSGTSPSMNSKKDDKFEKNYNISYVVFGDARKESITCLINYNRKTFEFLDNKFGKVWRNKVRKDAIGFSEFIKNE